MSRVYLAGQITGLSYEDAKHGWRDQFVKLMHRRDFDVRCVSPMRGKEGFINCKEMTPCPEEEEDFAAAISTSKAIVTRDYNDVRTADAMVVNFLGIDRASIGTCCEFGFAHAHRIPIVLIMEKEGNIHHHGFILEMAGYWVDTLEEAADITALLVGHGL